MKKALKAESHGNGRKRAVVITYNSVDGYPAGEYKGKEWDVTIYSNANTKTWGPDDAPGRLEKILGQVNGKRPDKVYLYAGLYAMNGALHAASHIAGTGVDMAIVACDCDWGYKQSAASQLGAKLIASECGGRRTLGKIVEKYLN